MPASLPSNLNTESLPNILAQFVDVTDLPPLAQASRPLTAQLRTVVNTRVHIGYENYCERLAVAQQLDLEWEELQDRERDGFRGLARLFRDDLGSQ